MTDQQLDAKSQERKVIELHAEALHTSFVITSPTLPGLRYLLTGDEDFYHTLRQQIATVRR